MNGRMQMLKMPIKDRIFVALEAFNFFSGDLDYRSKISAKLKLSLTPDKKAGYALTVNDFIVWLKEIKFLAHTGNKIGGILAILRMLADEGALTRIPKTDLLGLTDVYLGSGLISTDYENYLFYDSIYFFGEEAAAYIGNKMVCLVSGENSDGDQSSGSGVFIAPNMVLTCNHVVERLKDGSLNIRYENKEIKPVDLKCDPKTDVAILIFDSNVFKYNLPYLSETGLLNKVYILGFPYIPRVKKRNLVAYTGEINSISEGYDGNEYILISSMVRKGNSGGPILNAAGRISGIVTDRFFAPDTSNPNEATPLDPDNIPYFAGISGKTIDKSIKKMLSKQVIEMYQSS